MIVLKLILCFVVLVVIPELLGLLVSKFTKEKNIFFAFVLGYLFEFTSFELLYLILYFCDCSFRTVLYSWSSIMLIASIFSIIVNLKHFKKLYNSTVKLMESMPKIIIIFIILLCVQVYFPSKYMQGIDPDDAFYVALTTTTIENDSLFKINPYNGNAYSSRPLRYCFSALAIYFSTLSEILEIHPAIFQHTIWPAIAVILEFIIYAQIGNKLFKANKEKLSYYLIFLSVIHMFGFISIYTNFAFFAYRSWQGKALIANLIIPLALLCYWNCIENGKKIIYWLMLLGIMISSIFMTEMGVFLLPLVIGVLSIINLIQERKISNLLKSVLCCVPQLIVGILYFNLR